DRKERRRRTGGKMNRLRQFLTVPASESNMAIALSLSAVVMSLMLWAILWQTAVIEHQRDLIRVLWSGTTGS
ncbi:MAG TPA: hypothetical protein VEH50_14785, partial [Methylomirabilota bacterium]|nr:hypothetical protein [Methylomirabilota bacterium]